MSSDNWLVRRDLEMLEDEKLDQTEFDGTKLILRFGNQELVIEGKDLKVEVKGIQ